ncbi:MAG: ATP-dependent DNA helicase [Deltaproteobacteria bacterium]|jgi:ATP-dependent DNA helicase DinG|nr:ATP-dependent DNA helicase [Deltaproteobacteria bacterium]
MSNLDNIKKFFTANGPLAAWSGFTPRLAQTQMAEAVAQAFQDGRLAVIEAGTGVGKTLAYLIPAIVSRKKTVVSTGLVNLQEQILNKDLPVIRRYLQLNFTSCLLKGRRNYICLFKLWSFRNRNQSLFNEKIVTKAFNDLTDWVKNTEKGDKTEFLKVIGPVLPWDKLACGMYDCLGNKCHYQDSCFLLRARRAAQNADIILINHDILLSDFAIQGAGGGAFLPVWEGAVIDEAHLLESKATDYFGFEFDNVRLESLIRRLEKTFVEWSELTPFEDEVKKLAQLCDLLPTFFPNLQGERELFVDLYKKWNESFVKYLTKLLKTIYTIVNLLKQVNPDLAESDELVALAKELDDVALSIRFIAKYNDPFFVYQVDAQGKKITVSAKPLHVGPYLEKYLTQIRRTVIFTSATLSVNGDFTYFKKSLGIEANAAGLSLPSPYDYKRRTILYLPKHLPAPEYGSDEFEKAMIPEISRLLDASQGRTLILFTSNKDMNQTYTALSKEANWPLLLQTPDADRSALLKEFTDNVDSVLLATTSFWQGVDIPGESLSSVIIGKLPFPPPEKPLHKARSREIKRRGGNSFHEFSLPVAILNLKQGLGRLLRRETDLGLLTVLDKRHWIKNYGVKVRDSLPPSPRTADFEDVVIFFTMGPPASPTNQSPSQPPNPPVSPPSQPPGGPPPPPLALVGSGAKLSLTKAPYVR